MNPEKLFLEHLPLIERIATHACQRCRWSREDTEDFVSEVKIKLVDDDYGVIRKFEGKSGASLPTYLNIVIRRHFQDYRNHLWGKWRPAEEAKRSGKDAILLDQLLNRDGHSFDEACEILRTNFGVEQSWQELADLAARLPERSRRRMEGAEPLVQLPDPEQRTDERVVNRERAEQRARVWRALEDARRALGAEDQVLLRLYQEHKTVTGISRTLGRPARRLYRHLERIWKSLRRRLEKQGIRAEDVRDILGSGPWDARESERVPPGSRDSGARSVQEDMERRGGEGL